MDRDFPPNQPRKHGFSKANWQPHGKFKGEHGKSGSGRATAQDWFNEEKQPALGPKEKPAWNVWVAPNAKTPERRVSNHQPVSNYTTNASDDSATANGPQMHPDRLRLVADEQLEGRNGSSDADRWPPTLLREDQEMDGQHNGTHEKTSMPRDTGYASMSDEYPKSSEVNRSRPPSLNTEHRHIKQSHYDHHPSPASGRGTPGSSAMDVDELNPFTRRSSDRTAGAGTSTSTRQTTMSLPPPPPPDFHTEDSKAKLNSLVKTLGQFTTAVTSLASTNVQRDLAEKKAARQKTELDRWRKHHSTFTSLAEEHEREMARAKSASYLMDMKLQEHEAVRDEAIQAMAKTMLANGNVLAVSDAGDDKKVRRMQTDINDLRSEMNLNLERLRTIQYDPSHVKDLAHKQSEMRRAFHDLENRAATKQDLYDLDSHYISRSSFEEMDGRLNNCVVEWSNMNASLQQVDKIKEQMDSLSSLRLELDKVEERMNKLDGTLSTQEHTLQEFRHAVLGETDDQSLFDHIDRLAEDVNKFRATLKTFDEEIGTLSEDAHRQATRVDALELEISKRDKSTASNADGDTELRTTLEGVTSNVIELSEDLAQLKVDQETKDDLVGQESERLETALQALQSQVASLRSDFDAANNRIDVSLSELQSRPVPVAPLEPVPTPEVSSNVPVRSDDPLIKELAGTVQEHRRALKQHYDKMQAVEAFQISLSQRFDNLTTDRLAQNMVHQMQKMWPNAADVKVDVDQIKEREGQLKSEVDSLKTAFNTLQQRIETEDLSGAFKVHRDELVALACTCENLLGSTASKEAAFQMAIQSLDSELKSRIKALNEDVHKANNNHIFLAEVSEQLRLDIEKISERVGLMEQTNIVEISALHGQVVELKNICESQATGSHGLESTIVVSSDGPGRNSKDQALPSSDKGSATEPDTTAHPGGNGMRRHSLMTKKEKKMGQKEKEKREELEKKERMKRKRISSSDTEGDDGSKRRVEEA